MLAASRWILWVVLACPLAIQTWRYLVEIIYYGEYLHWTGEQSARLLIVTLAITPARRLFPKIRALRWFVARRRDLGIATFLYAAMHTLAYLVKKSNFKVILSEASEIGVLLGWLAFVVILLLAATSNDYSVRRLGPHWKTLHRYVYGAALLTFLHWILTAFDPTAGFIHLGVLIVLLALRAWPASAQVRH
ncbi:MAG: ferric reductase-like transmembrane domain-containing protein [Gammaproteobacteria bacterium]|nr:ferric reductase-like transmembrane domain-containing protein [Gammaproteobacteria bacterium]